MRLPIFHILATTLLFTMNIMLQASNTPKGNQEIQIGENSKLHRIQKDETANVVHLNNGDFFLHYEILTGKHGSNQTMQYWIAHFIPTENNRFLVEDRLDSEGYSTYSSINNIPLWYDTIYPDDIPMKKQGYADELPIYILLLEYYQTHQSEILILKEE